MRFADEQYLSQFSALYSDFEIGQIASFSQAPFDSIELVNLEHELYQDTDALESYLERKFDHYNWRANNEYRLVRPLSTRAFPYNYLSAYANKYTSADHPHEIKKIVFIYCIKNHIYCFRVNNWCLLNKSSNLCESRFQTQKNFNVSDSNFFLSLNFITYNFFLLFLELLKEKNKDIGILMSLK